ncbi:hypothetical protein MFIFM68171_03973 [Madurella fahalii]|uniref:Uncharacterized protein n=1 Tax=Madurella fahalii TaxID=1157608 RepID=A0ABQ0G7M6_9PEZI
MVTSSSHPMETIVESSPEKARIPGASAEAMLFSVVRSSQLNTGVAMSTSTRATDVVDHRSGRSSSLKVPATRKASQLVREWVKRSNSSRAGSAAGPSSSETLKAQIRHLGGGRVEVAEAEEATPPTKNALAVPRTRRPQKNRPSSIDSRVTQWLDFYPEATEEAKSQSQLNQPSQAPSRSLPPNQSRHRHRSDSNGDLRPAPLRVPSLEKQGSRSPQSKALVRKNSKWKALPSLPGQQPDVAEQAASSTSANQGGKAESEREPRSQRQDGTAPLPVIRYGTPPPTPDSTTDGAARVLRTSDTRVTTPGTEPEMDTSAKGVPKRVDSDRLDRHTGQERVWLHVNYRGEAPFLHAWGLDITKLADRLEGLSILRDLMQAEKEKRGADAGGSHR